MPNLVDEEGKVLVSPDGDKAVRVQGPDERPEPDQPSPTRGDGELYDMVDPVSQVDRGGNPLMEGELAQDDNGWLPDGKRDDYYAHKDSSVYDFTDPDPLYTFLIDKTGRVYSATGNADYDAIAAQHGIDGYETTQGQIFPGGQGRLEQDQANHSTQQLTQMLQQYLQQNVQFQNANDPARPAQIPPYTTQHQVSKPAFSRSLYADPYEGLWERKAEMEEPKGPEHLAHQVEVVPSPSGIDKGTIKHLAFLDAKIDGRSTRKDSSIESDYTRGGDRYGFPVVVSVDQASHLEAARSVVQDSLKGLSPEPFLSTIHAMKTGSVPAPQGVDLDEVKITREAFLPAAAVVGRALLGQAIGGIVRGAFNGQGSNQAPQGQPIDQSTQTLGALDRGLTNSTGFPESEDGDTHQYNDGDLSPDFQNPNLDNDGGATKGEDETHKSKFADDSPGLSRAEQLLEKLIHYFHSDQSGAQDDELRDLDSLLETEHPGYKDDADDDAVHKLFLTIKSPEGISHHEKANEKKGKTSDNHQGPVTDEQRAAVTQFLQSQGRDAEVQTMLLEPWKYAEELTEVTGDNQRPNPINPDTNPAAQPPPPPAEMDPTAQMPVPDPQQSMAAPLAKRWSKIVRVSAPPVNPVAVPAADQTTQDQTQNITDSTGSWQDVNGQPLVKGQTYTVRNPQYAVPDVNRIVDIKPDALVVESVGQYQNTPGVDPEENQPVVHQHEITREEVQMEGLTFEPGDPQQQDQQTAQDPSLQATAANREWLLSDDDDMTKEAGVKFTPNEQREFIDEQGVARNADKLDLAGTHYERKSNVTLDDSFLW